MDDKARHRRHRGAGPTGGEMGLTVTADERIEARRRLREAERERIARNRAAARAAAASRKDRP